MKKIVTLILITLLDHSASAQIWIPVGAGLNSQPTAITAKNTILAVASSQTKGKTRIYTIRAYVAPNWVTLPTIEADSSSYIRALYYYKGALYIGGKFNSPNDIIGSKNVVRWRGGKYEAVPNFSSNMLNFSSVDDFSEFNGNLIISGNFKNTKLSTYGIAFYNGQELTNAPAQFSNGVVGRVLTSTVIDENQILFGGVISKITNASASNLALYNKATGWTNIKNPKAIVPVKSATNGTSTLLFGQSLGREHLNFYNINKFDSLVPLDIGISSITTIYDVVEVDNIIYASGIFEMEDNKDEQQVIAFNGTKWESIINGKVSGARLLGNFKEQLVCSGSFVSSSVINSNYIALYKQNAGLVSGFVFFDKNKNCEFDFRDEALSNMSIRVVATNQIIRPNEKGFYYAYLRNGKHKLQILPPKTWSAQDCAGEIIELELGGGQILSGQNFPMMQQTGVKNAAVYLHSLSGLKQTKGRKAAYVINYSNLGSENIATTEINLQYDGRLTNFKSKPEPTSIAGNTLKWQVSDLYAGSNSAINVQFDFNTTTDQDLNLVASIAVEDGETDSEDNTSALTQKLSDEDYEFRKDVYPSNGGDTAYLHDTSKTVRYQISFANYTTDTITTVVVIDSIKLNHNLQYIKELGKSHSASLSAYSGKPGTDVGVLVWRFENINLPPNPEQSNEIPNHSGFVSFEIGLNENKPQGLTLTNEAGVVFDFYDEEKTNNVYSIVNNNLVSVRDIETHQSASVYPNPVSSTLYINTDEVSNPQSYTIYNLSGSVNLSGSLNFLNGIDVSALSSGMYQVAITDKDNSLYYSKFLKQ